MSNEAGRPQEIENAVSFTVVVPLEDKDSLKSIAKELDVSMSALVRDVIEDFLGRYRDGKIKFG